tara:strand:- start:265 stop:819 length:555 start_codon:yes stop_codon:yes gene_type:complete
MINLPHIQNRAEESGVNNISQLSLLEPRVQNAAINSALIGEIVNWDKVPAMTQDRTPKVMGNKGFSYINNIAGTDRCPYGMTTIYKAIKDGRIAPEFVKPGTPSNRHMRVQVEEVVKVLDQTTNGPRKRDKARIRSVKQVEAKRNVVPFAYVSEERFIEECKRRGTDEVLNLLIEADKQNINEN